LTPGKRHPVPIGQEAGWISDLVWTQRLEELPFASAGERTPVRLYIINAYSNILDNLKERYQLGDLGVDGSIILKLILKERDVCQLDSSGSG
jgi:hypothetical protein